MPRFSQIFWALFALAWLDLRNVTAEVDVRDGRTVPTEVIEYIEGEGAKRRKEEAKAIEQARREMITVDDWAKGYVYKILNGDIDGDGDLDTVVGYSLQGMGGGNYYESNLALFLREGGKLIFKTQAPLGGKPNIQAFGVLDPVAIQKGRIACKCISYREDSDPAIKCPKGKPTYDLIYKGGRFSDAMPPWK